MSRVPERAQLCRGAGGAALRTRPARPGRGAVGVEEHSLRATLQKEREGLEHVLSRGSRGSCLSSPFPDHRRGPDSCR